MRRRLAGALAAMLVLCGSPLATAKDCETAKTQSDLDACASDALTNADAALNLTYKNVVGRLARVDASRNLLVTAQKAWIGFRDDECAFEASTSTGGSIHPMIVTECKTTLTKARTEALRRLLECGKAT